jgi:carbon starvation protein
VSRAIFTLFALSLSKGEAGRQPRTEQSKEQTARRLDWKTDAAFGHNRDALPVNLTQAIPTAAGGFGMDTLLIAVLSAVGFIVAYHTYGRYLSRKIFNLAAGNLVPSKELEDGKDYVPTRKSVLFGHHFTSIAGTGPIVGPAIAVFWGWLPALLWVVFGSIFIGAVHDLGSLVVSLRSRGQTIGDIAGRMIHPRARVLLLIILFFTLVIVIAVFGLVIAVIFSVYPESVLSVWVAMPVAVAVGLWIYRVKGSLLVPSLLGLFLLYVSVYLGANDIFGLRISLTELFGVPLFAGKGAGLVAGLSSSVVIWTLLLLVYCFFASVLPVWLLLQPRDYINALQLAVALVLLMAGLIVAHPPMVAPAIATAPADAPPILPFLFITVACGAISGFHSLVSSGTSSKQLRSEADAQFIGYGSMLIEGALAVIVILACCAGLGLGIYESTPSGLMAIRGADGAVLVGREAWQTYYGGAWSEMTFTDQIGAFIEGAANMIAVLPGMTLPLAVAITAVMVSCFAATTLDTATRLQRYVIQELGSTLRLAFLTNKYVATTVAVATGGAVALISGPNGPGSGGLILWPLFGAINQLLAGLAFLVIAFYLVRHGKPVWFLAAPLALMVIVPAWAMGHNIVQWSGAGQWLLVVLGVAVLALQGWMVVESLVMWRQAKGVLPVPLPPLMPAAQPEEAIVPNDIAVGQVAQRLERW